MITRTKINSTCSNILTKVIFQFLQSFELASATYSYNTRQARNGLLFVPRYNSVRFKRQSIIHSTKLTWNHFWDKFAVSDFLNLTRRSLKLLLSRYFISIYDS